MQVTEVDVFDVFATAVRKGFDDALQWGGQRLFQTDAKEAMVPAYLAGFHDPADRKHHDCSACKHFLRRFGTLVAIDAAGDVRSVWSFVSAADTPPHFAGALLNLELAVLPQRVNGVFVAAQAELGTAVTGDWHHFAYQLPASLVHQDRTKTAGQKMAEHRAEFDMLRRGLDEFTLETFERAVTLLAADVLYRSEKFLGAATALRDLKQQTADLKQHRRDPILWRAVATLPAGVCHVRSSMLGTLFADLQSGMDTASARRRFDEKADPMRYQRPQAAPKAGNIAQAEKLVEQLGIQRSLPRRFVALDEVLIRSRWLPAAPPTDSLPVAPKPAGGVFAGLAQPSGAAAAGAPSPIAGARMSWQKFCSQVLPRAEAIQLLVTDAEMTFGGLTTAVDADAPPLFAWDDAGERNPFSWYRWQGAAPADFGLQPHQPATVSALLHLPSMWSARAPLHEGALLVLAGAADAKVASYGSALFPELMRPELRPVRATINAYSIANALAVPAGALALGLVLRKGVPINAVLRVTVRGAAIDYGVDRWD
jgi:hypothetical protein